MIMSGKCRVMFMNGKYCVTIVPHETELDGLDATAYAPRETEQETVKRSQELHRKLLINRHFVELQVA